MKKMKWIVLLMVFTTVGCVSTKKTGTKISKGTWLIEQETVGEGVITVLSTKPSTSVEFYTYVLDEGNHKVYGSMVEREGFQKVWVKVRSNWNYYLLDVERGDYRTDEPTVKRFPYWSYSNYDRNKYVSYWFKED